MQAWREPRTCGECAECAYMVRVDDSGITDWWQCLQDGRRVRKEDDACPLFDSRRSGS